MQHSRSGALPLVWHLGASGRFCYSLAVYQTDRSGYHFGGYQTGRMPCPPNQIPILDIMYRKIYEKTGFF